MLADLLLLSYLAVAGLAALTVFALAVRRPPLYLLVVLVFYILNEALVSPVWVPEIGIFGLSLYFNDLATASAFVGALVRWRHVQVKNNAITTVVVVLWISMLQSLVRGIFQWGVQPTLNEARSALAFLAFLAYGATLEPTVRQLKNWSYVVVLMLSAAFLFRTVIPGTSADSRPLMAQAALLLLDGIVVGEALGSRLLVALVGVLVILLNAQKSIWLAMAALAAFQGLLRPRRMVPIRLLSVAGVVVAIATPFVATRWQEGISERGTLSWRTTSWQALISQLNGTEVLFGKSWGSGYIRSVFGLRRSEYAHNEFVQIIIRQGYIGLTLLSLLLLLLFIRLFSSRDSIARPLRFCLVAALIAGWSNGWDFHQGLLLGMCATVGLASVKKKRLVHEGRSVKRPITAHSFKLERGV